MTIPQAHSAGYFDVARLSKDCLKEAVAVQRDVLQRASHVFTLTEWAKSSVVSDFGVPDPNVSPVYIGSNIDLSGIQRPQRDPCKIVFIGIDWVRKGGPELLSGFQELQRRIPQARLTIIGCSPSVRQHGLTVLGYLSPKSPENRARIAEELLSASIFCMLSDFEPLGNVFVEAYAAGLPIVAFDHGSRREIVDHGRTGLLLQDREPATVADALEWLIRNPVEARRMGESGQGLVQSRFNWDTIVRQIRDVIFAGDEGGM